MSLRLEVLELKKARVESQKFEQARNSSHTEALQRENNLRNLLFFKDKQLADLRNQRSSPSQDLLDLQSQLHALEQAKQDDAEAAEVQYRELKERYDTQLEELQRGIDVATRQQLHEASTSERHLQTIKSLGQQLQKIEAKASEKYQELEKQFADVSRQWRLDEARHQEDHEGVVASLCTRIEEVEDEYAKLGSEAQAQRRTLEDQYKDQLQAATQQWEQDRREDHQRVVEELNGRIVELESVYAKLGSDAQDQRQQLEAQYRNQSAMGDGNDSQCQQIEDLECQLSDLRQQHLHDMEEAKQRYDLLQDSTSRDRQMLEDDWQKRLASLENTRHQDVDHEAGIAAGFQAQLRLQQDVLDDLQSRISAMQDQHKKERQDAETHQNEIHQQLQQACQNLEEAEGQITQYQELENAQQQTPTSTADMARALETAISDAQRDAEANFNAWKAAHEQELQAECDALRGELHDLCAHCQSLQQGTVTNDVEMDRSSFASGRRHGKQCEVLDVRSFSRRPVYPPVATSRSGLGFSSLRRVNLQMPVSNIRSTTLQSSNPVCNATPGPSSRPTIPSRPLAGFAMPPTMRAPINPTATPSTMANASTSAHP
ncbi:hypothetical protein CCMSSC00406_0009159 [Pleurotus cornucopiae]|uniref:Uncharacterized protein n=1 Tax=Pleurotus cornucopiae TaxID=5321 RepID=A0ACB7IVS7_PLECO|nr:hypothetical protein CCMSSC00406_0009159 [Pleurotus cornucopiae]